MSWPAGLDGEGLVASPEGPGGQVDVALLDGRRHLVDPDASRGQGLGSTWTRTAYFWEPKTWTWATPLTMEMRWAIRVSAYSSTSDRGRVGELSER